MSFETIIKWCDIAVAIGYVVLLLFIWYYLAFFILSFKKSKSYHKSKNKYRYLIIVPARNEDKVIKNIFNSLKAQTYDKDFFDVYVITESKDDATNLIAKDYGYNYFVRKDLINKHTKGYAIKEFLDYINKLKNKKHYDSYIIFDADNIMDADYIEKLNDLKDAGYQVGFGYRNFTNSNRNWITSCSAVLLSLLNNVFSKGRFIMFKKVLINGTGYFIDKNIIDDIGYWSFVGLTEDVEVSTYCTYHNIKMGYYEEATFYDEEPESFKIMHKQHIRWIWGFCENRKVYKKLLPDYGANSEKVSRISRYEFNMCIWPFVVYIVFCILAYLVELVIFILSFFYDSSFSGWLFGHMQIPFFSVYFSFFITALIVTLNNNKKHLHFSWWQKVYTIFSFPFFFMDFVLAFFDGLNHPHKRKNWTPIEHVGHITSKQAKEVEHEETRVEKN